MATAVAPAPAAACASCAVGHSTRQRASGTCRGQGGARARREWAGLVGPEWRLAGGCRLPACSPAAAAPAAAKPPLLRCREPAPTAGGRGPSPRRGLCLGLPAARPPAV
jgi:hypothetical protein